MSDLPQDVETPEWVSSPESAPPCTARPEEVFLNYICWDRVCTCFFTSWCASPLAICMTSSCIMMPQRLLTGYHWSILKPYQIWMFIRRS